MTTNNIETDEVVLDEEPNPYVKASTIALAQYKSGERGAVLPNSKRVSHRLMTDGGESINKQRSSGWWGDLPENRRKVNAQGIAAIKKRMGW